MTMARYFRLSNGRKMPSIGLGTFEMTGDTLKEALDFAISVGYTHIDTAFTYGNEKDIGEVVTDRLKSGKSKRKDIFITSKVPRTFLQQEKEMKACVQNSLENLRTLSLDMLLIHHPWASVVENDEQGNPQERYLPSNILETWRAMESVYKAGMAANIGVSNFTAEQLKNLLDIQKIPVSNVQLESHVYYQQRGLKKLCNKYNIVISAYAPLGAPARPGHHMTRSDSLLTDPLVLQVAERCKKTPAQVLLNFLLKNGMVVLPKSSNRERLQENIGCLGWSLSDDDFRALQGLNRGIRFFEFLHMRGHPDFHEGKEF